MNTTTATTATLLASMTVANQSGTVLTGPRISPITPEPMKKIRNAINHLTPARTSAKTSAPSGAKTPQMPTALAAMKPPNGIIETVGLIRMLASSMRRKTS